MASLQLFQLAHGDSQVSTVTPEATKISEANYSKVENPVAIMEVMSSSLKSTDSQTIDLKSISADVSTLKSANTCDSSTDVDAKQISAEHPTANIQAVPKIYMSKKRLAGGVFPLPTRRPFNVPKFPNMDPTSFDPNSTDHSVEDSPVRPRKRKVLETEADADNLDDLIASLKRVAERDRTPGVLEKIKKKASSRNIPLENLLFEKLSLLNLPRQGDDDDLESLGSVDTDMAPASETSRDLECTYSDLESVNESVSSRDVLSTTRVQTPVLDGSSFESPINKEESYKSEMLIKISEKSTPVSSKNRKLNSNEKAFGKWDDSNFDILPVEKLEAMIAELDQVISDTDTSEAESTDTPNKMSDSGDSVARGAVAVTKVPPTTESTENKLQTVMTSFIPSSEKPLPSPEKATLVTLISRPTSEESLASRKYVGSSVERIVSEVSVDAV